MSIAPVVRVGDIRPRPHFLLAWEHVRRQHAVWLIECITEAVVVFMYCYAGLGAQAAFTIGNLARVDGMGSLFSVGFSYTIGLGLGLIVANATFGSHFSPSVTAVRVIFEGFPIRKAARYIAAQVLGGYLASLLVYAQWRNAILEVENALIATNQFDSVMFTTEGPAGIFALYAPAGANLCWVFLNEFVNDFMLGLVMYACLDPGNLLISPRLAPWVISFSFGVAIWGFSPVGLSANAAPDVGGRLAALTIWGTKAAGGRYGWIAALTTFPATILAYLFYEIVFVDSNRVVSSAARKFVDAQLQAPVSPASGQTSDRLEKA